MSALANTIRQLTGRLALLRAERERYQALCAAAYQLAGQMNAPVRWLDAFSDAANGEIEARQRTEDLTPVLERETGTFPAALADLSDGELFDAAEKYLTYIETPNGGHVHAALNGALVDAMKEAIKLAREKEPE
ncbi:hypothetical protein [Burkholderia ubonensis]|uniref:hypothetical protein n=1 Tax=Burkholderia ubonensis TaxID=101571 RepID=UPI00075E3BA0|nr:hypothetical protein [Burkholderia ubonensis]KVC81405.1 hypothetical protein WI75_08640 [Burkholderia ubonensis]